MTRKREFITPQSETPHQERPKSILLELTPNEELYAAISRLLEPENRGKFIIFNHLRLSHVAVEHSSIKSKSPAILDIAFLNSQKRKSVTDWNPYAVRKVVDDLVWYAKEIGVAVQINKFAIKDEFTPLPFRDDKRVNLRFLYTTNPDEPTRNLSLYLSENPSIEDVNSITIPIISALKNALEDAYAAGLTPVIIDAESKEISEQMAIKSALNHLRTERTEKLERRVRRRQRAREREAKRDQKENLR